MLHSISFSFNIFFHNFNEKKYIIKCYLYHYYNNMFSITHIFTKKRKNKKPKITKTLSFPIKKFFIFNNFFSFWIFLISSTFTVKFPYYFFFFKILFSQKFFLKIKNNFRSFSFKKIFFVFVFLHFTKIKFIK